MRIVFFGSSDFSIPLLEYCLRSGHQLAAVVTTPDRPKGRGLMVQANPVRQHCDKGRVPTFSPSLLKDTNLTGQMEGLTPDLFIVASYGKLIPTPWLKIPKQLALNIHPSLVPRYRGAAPIPWQILNGERETGVSVIEVTPRLDAGDIFFQVRIPLGNEETTESLTERLAGLACEALDQTLKRVEGGILERTPQNESESTYARKLEKEDGCVAWTEPALVLERKIRAFHPWPGTLVPYTKGWLRVLSGACEAGGGGEGGSSALPGTILEINPQGFLKIQTGEGTLKLLKVQLPGRRPVSGLEFANGQRLKIGHRLSSQP